MQFKAKNISGIVCDCRFVKAGSNMINGREVTWVDGSRIFIVVEGEREVTKYRVNPNSEKKVAAFFESAPFGIYVNLTLDIDGLVVDVKA